MSLEEKSSKYDKLFEKLLNSTEGIRVIQLLQKEFIKRDLEPTTKRELQIETIEAWAIFYLFETMEGEEVFEERLEATFQKLFTRKSQEPDS